MTIDAAPYSTCLSREYYFDEAIFQAELKQVFARQWLLVGHVSQIKAPGQFYVRQVGPESLIIARDRAGAIRAWFNVCRHRGYRIADDWSSGTSNGHVCPYHKWAYDTDGQLVSVPGSRDGQDFRFCDWGLHEARCETFHGWIYVWLSEDVPTQLRDGLHFADEAALEAIGSERLKLAHRKVYDVACNWKALLENDCECYHCGRGGHPSLAISCEYTAFYTDKANGKHFPLRDGMKTFSMDGERVCSIPLGTPQPDGFSTGFLSFPNFCGPVFFVDHAVSLELTPLSVGRSQFIAEWYVHEDALEGVHYSVDRLIEVFHTTNLEDVALAERNYAGMRSMRYSPGPLNPRREDGIRFALDLYERMMGSDVEA